MRSKLIVFAAVLPLVALGCSGVSNVERASLTSLEAREAYVAAHPDNVFSDCIRNGEITKGMSAYEVVASWGLPNVYAVSKSKPGERWIYYLRDKDSLSLLIYTLSFSDDTLRVWDIDQRRVRGESLVTSVDLPTEAPRDIGQPTKRRR